MDVAALVLALVAVVAVLFGDTRISLVALALALICQWTSITDQIVNL